MRDTRVKFGVIGAGGIARRKTIPGILTAEHCRLVAVMDPVGAQDIAAEFGVPKAYQNVEDLLADKEVQAVYIASPVACHLPQIKLAAAAGKHILCEKPLAMNPRQARTAVAACRRRKVLLQEGYMMKFHGAHTEIKRRIAAGRLGRLVYLRAQLACWYPPIAGAWRQHPATGGGGALIDMASHLFDLLEYFAGPVRAVGALTGNLVQDYASEDAATILLRFASGAHGTIDCFFCIPDEASRTRLEIYGSRGAILTEGTIGQSTAGRAEGIYDLGRAVYDAAQNKDGATTFAPIPFTPVDPYAAECEYFARCVRARRQPALNGPLNALRMARLTERAYASARGGRFLAI